MLKKVLIISFLFLILVVLSILGINYWKVFLFQDSAWILAAAASLGLLSGGLLAGFKKEIEMAVPAGLVKRHTLISFMEHWGTTLGLLISMISGLLLIINPSLLQMNLHFLGLILIFIFGDYFLADFLVSKKLNNLLPSFTDILDGTLKKYLFRTKWSDHGKYLASQKSSFLAFIAFGFGIAVTGVIKVIGIIWSLPVEIIRTSTSIHDISAILFSVMVFIHIILVLSVPSNRRLFNSWFTGTIAEQSLKTEAAVTVPINSNSDFKILYPSGFTNAASYILDSRGVIQTAAKLVTEDGELTLDIAAKTRLLDQAGGPLSQLSMGPPVDPPPPPESSTIILARELGPRGAAFDPPLALTMKYRTLPAGADEKTIRMVFWNGETWQSLPGAPDPVNRTVTAGISHPGKYALVSGQLICKDNEDR
jgi:cytochrome b subunit of formate dehydrogenase